MLNDVCENCKFSVLLRHLLISMEVLTKKWTPAEFGTQEFLKKRKMINRHSIKIFSTSLSSDSIERNSVLESKTISFP